MRLHLGEVDALGSQPGEREIEHVGRFPDHVLAGGGLAQLGRLLAQLGGEEAGSWNRRAV